MRTFILALALAGAAFVGASDAAQPPLGGMILREIDLPTTPIVHPFITGPNAFVGWKACSPGLTCPGFGPNTTLFDYQQTYLPACESLEYQSYVTSCHPTTVPGGSCTGSSTGASSGFCIAPFMPSDTWSYATAGGCIAFGNHADLETAAFYVFECAARGGYGSFANNRTGEHFTLGLH